MIVKLTLMGGLKAKSPPGNTLEIADGSSIEQILSALDIEPAQVQIVMVNGKPQPNRDTVVDDGAELTVVAPVGGG